MSLDNYFSSPGLKISTTGDDLLIMSREKAILDILDEYYSKRNPKEPFTRFLPRDYHQILLTLENNGILVSSQISMEIDFPELLTLAKNYDLYEFQTEAVEKWMKLGDRRGTIILPTGGGKSIIAIDIIRKLQVCTLIVVPTLVLFEQWKEKIRELLEVDDEFIGFFGGGKKEIRPITIITYNSAKLYSRTLRYQFDLLILDEAHHLVGQYELIADGYLARYRLALSATLNENETVFTILMEKGFGPVVYTTSPKVLVDQKVLTTFEIETIKVNLDNREGYDTQIRILQNYIKSKRLRGNVFQKILFRVNKDPKAAKAMQAYRTARDIAFAAEMKLNILHQLLEVHNLDKVLIFSDIVSFCEKISRIFTIPCITYRTSQEERRYILNWFKESDSAKLVSSKILDEGVDIPDASIGIIMAGSGIKRQFIQRLGRIIRIHEDKTTAKLYEVVSSQTMEERISTKRKKE